MSHTTATNYNSSLQGYQLQPNDAFFQGATFQRTPIVIKPSKEEMCSSIISSFIGSTFLILGILVLTGYLPSASYYATHPLTSFYPAGISMIVIGSYFCLKLLCQVDAFCAVMSKD